MKRDDEDMIEKEEEEEKRKKKKRMMWMRCCKEQRELGGETTMRRGRERRENKDSTRGEREYFGAWLFGWQLGRVDWVGVAHLGGKFLLDLPPKAFGHPNNLIP